MKGVQQLLSLTALVTVALAGGSIDNSEEAKFIRSRASTLSGNCNYVFKNVATGQQLSFRRDSVTNFFPSLRGGDSLEVQFEDGAARISGGNNKCASAQWSYDIEGGVDAFAASYACAVSRLSSSRVSCVGRSDSGAYASDVSQVGQGQSNDGDLEKTKQCMYTSRALRWYFVEASGFGSSDDGNNPPSPGLSLAAKSRKATTSSSDVSDGLKKPASSKYGATTTFLSRSKGFYEYPHSRIPLKLIDQSKVIRGKPATRPCIHPGWWLHNHPTYVTKDGHVECKDDLNAYRASLSSARMARRSRIASREGSSKVVKRAPKAYYIIAQDHLDDMATRAIGSKTVSSFGGYTSTNLVLWDKSDEHQLWTIVAE
ncbi:BQ2448_2221 [Microbotryum intermedium]|uniref:BQ2448_2221 protein n=1 Tax=Microbotryum intermedium TaxID=269621 RepID=A0A238FAU3_9BASI|nr:BQ2448_2221 [Microbotryum intermedium]